MKHENDFRQLSLKEFGGEPEKEQITEQLIKIRKVLIHSSGFGKQPIIEQFRQCRIIMILLLQTAEGSVIPDLFVMNVLMDRFFPNRFNETKTVK